MAGLDRAITRYAMLTPMARSSLAMPIKWEDTFMKTFIPQSGDLTILDPIINTVYTVRNHGYMVFDTLFGMDSDTHINRKCWKATRSKMTANAGS
jgi:hypothetical protein